MIYPYKCAGCGAVQDVWQSLSEYCSAPRVPDHCGAKMNRHYTVPMVTPDYAPFISHVDGSVINSRSAQREHMVRHNLMLHDDVAADLPSKRKAVVEAGFASLKSDINEAIVKVEQGYVPHPDIAEVKGDSTNWQDGIDVTTSLPEKEIVQSLGA